MTNLYKILEPQGRKITFISDRNKGLLESVRNVFPDAYHAFCLHHLKQNVNTKYPAAMGKSYRQWIVKCFKRCAYAPTTNHFDTHMSKLTKDGGETMKKFLQDTPKEHWSNACLPGIINYFTFPGGKSKSSV